MVKAPELPWCFCSARGSVLPEVLQVMFLSHSHQQQTECTRVCLDLQRCCAVRERGYVFIFGPHRRGICRDEAKGQLQQQNNGHRQCLRFEQKRVWAEQTFACYVDTLKNMCFQAYSTISDLVKTSCATSQALIVRPGVLVADAQACQRLALAAAVLCLKV